MSKFIKKTLWNLQRFGFTPEKIKCRLTNKNEPRILCISVPKAGTHLLERALCLHPLLYRKLLPTVNTKNLEEFGGLETLLKRIGPGQIVVSHLNFAPERLQLIRQHNVKCFFLIRNPKDIVVSRLFYVMKNKRHFAHKKIINQSSLKERLLQSIQGDTALGWWSILETLDLFRGWLTSGFHIVRFEDLVGPQGSGDITKQQSTLQAIFEYCDLEISSELLWELSLKLFSPDSPTFRKGAIGQWQQYFDEELTTLFKETIGSRLNEYGYD